MDSENPKSFAALLRQLRQRHFHKQLAFAAAVGCTEAAVSYWENGKRAPNQDKLPSIVSAMAAAGAESEAIRLLVSAWNRLHRATRLARQHALSDASSAACRPARVGHAGVVAALAA